MADAGEPVPGGWYRNPEDGSEFEVVAVDSDEDRIEIQYAAGDLDELDADSWSDLEAEPIDAPAGWDFGGESVDPDDFGYSDTGEEPGRWERRGGSPRDDELGVHERDDGEL